MRRSRDWIAKIDDYEDRLVGAHVGKIGKYVHPGQREQCYGVVSHSHQGQ